MRVESLACSRFRDRLCGHVAGEVMKHAAQSIIAACVLASASPAAAQIINGGFEEGAFGGGRVREVSRGDTALSGWTVNDNPIAWYANGYEPNPLAPIGVCPHV